MVVLCIILFLICILEAIVILWIRNADKKEKNIENTIKFFRDLWGKFTFYVLATSIIGLFLGSIYFEKVIGLEIINSWVSIVLGLVALIIGIISLFLSFYNVDQSNSTQEKTVDILKKFEVDMIDRMNNLQHDMEKKIDESGERTRAELKGGFKSQSSNSKITDSNSMIWENEKNE